MKILLILPPPCKSGDSGLLARFVPYLTVSVGAHLIKNGYEVRVFDAFFEKASFSDIAREVSEYQPKVIGVNLAEIVRTVPFEVSLSMVEYLKIKHPLIVFIGFGGKGTDFAHKYFEKNEKMDYFIIGDPEETMVDLVRTLEKNQEVNSASLEGLLYKEQGKIVFTGRRTLKDLDRLEFPAWDLISKYRYFSVPHRYSSLSFYPLSTSRGCRWDKCTFCQDNTCVTRYSPYRVKSPQRVVEEIVYAHQKYGYQEIQFGDQHFNLERNWLLELESELKRQQLSIRWSCLARVDMVSPEILSIMHRMGCWNILFGIESGCEHLLSIINKGITVEQSKNAVRWCSERGIEVTGSFLIGLPGEKPEDVYHTVRFARNIGVDYAQFFIAKWGKPHVGFKHMGYLTDQFDFPKYDFCGKIFVPQDYKGILHLKDVQRNAYLRFYLHPATIMRHLKKIKAVSGMKRLLAASKILFYFIFNAERESGQDCYY